MGGCSAILRAVFVCCFEVATGHAPRVFLPGGMATFKEFDRTLFLFFSFEVF